MIRHGLELRTRERRIALLEAMVINKDRLSKGDAAKIVGGNFDSWFSIHHDLPIWEDAGGWLNLISPRNKKSKPGKLLLKRA